MRILALFPCRNLHKSHYMNNTFISHYSNSQNCLNTENKNFFLHDVNNNNKKFCANFLIFLLRSSLFCKKKTKQQELYNIWAQKVWVRCFSSFTALLFVVTKKFFCCANYFFLHFKFNNFCFLFVMFLRLECLSICYKICFFL